MLQFIRDEKAEVRNAILESGQLTDETEEALIAALEEFKQRWAATSGATQEAEVAEATA